MIFFLQDHSPIHDSRGVQNWFQSQRRIKLLPFVPRSPDLNPIENMWAEVTATLASGARNANDLWSNIETTWWEVNNYENLSKHLALSAPRRLRAILENDGGWVGY